MRMDDDGDGINDHQSTRLCVTVILPVDVAFLLLLLFCMELLTPSNCDALPKWGFPKILSETPKTSRRRFWCVGISALQMCSMGGPSASGAI